MKKEIYIYAKPNVVLWYNPKTEDFENFGKNTLKQVFNLCEAKNLIPVFL